MVDGDVGIALGLLDHEADHLAPILDAVGSLLGPLVADTGDRIEPDRPAAAGRNLGLAKGMSGERTAEHADGLFGARNLGTAAGSIHVDGAKLLIELRGGDALGLH